MKWGGFVPIVLLALVLLVANACGGGGAAPTPTPTPTPIPTPTPTLNDNQGETVRPPSGIIYTTDTSGWGELTVENGLDQDGVVILTSMDDETVMSTYIRSDDEYTMDDIPDGLYQVYFCTGSSWDESSAKFTKDVYYRRFEDNFEFETTVTAYTTYEITLHGVVGGQAYTESVNADDFPDIVD